MDVFKNIPTHVDFVGQRRAEKLYQIIITLFGIVGLVVSYIYQQFSYTVYILGVGFVLCAVLIIPPWPVYRMNPLQWRKPRPEPKVAEESKASHPKKK